MSADASGYSGGGGIHGVLRIIKTVAIGGAEHVQNGCENLLAALGWREKDDVDVDPMNGKVVVVTGANVGIGLATAKQLARRGAHVIMACRNLDKAKSAAQSIGGVVPYAGCGSPTVEVAPLDLASLDSVRAFARDFNRRGLPLDVLVCNAGLMSPAARLETQDGLEMQFQVNFLSHWLLAHELLAEQRRRRKRQGGVERGGTVASAASAAGAVAGAGLKGPAASITVQARSASPPPGTGLRSRAPGGGSGGTGAEGTRVVFVSSLTHYSGMNQWDDKQSLRRYSPFVSYAWTKLAEIMATKEMQRRIDRHPECGPRDIAVAVHPGIVHTNLATGFFKQQGSAVPFLEPVLRPLVSAFVDHIFPSMMKSTEKSARIVLRAVTAPGEVVAGQYIAEGRVVKACSYSDNRALCAELWDLASELTGIRPEDATLA